MKNFGLQAVRIQIPAESLYDSGPAQKFFKFLPNNTDLTEEFLYAHQPTTQSRIRIFATSPNPIGEIDEHLSLDLGLKAITGPAIVVARKGYAGRMFVVPDKKFLVHEDAYAVSLKDNFQDKILIDWFARHYSFEFQGHRTSLWGIGDFPREKFKSLQVLIPNLKFQQECTALYERRDNIIERIETYQVNKTNFIQATVLGLVNNNL